MYGGREATYYEELEATKRKRLGKLENRKGSK